MYCKLREHNKVDHHGAHAQSHIPFSRTSRLTQGSLASCVSLYVVTPSISLAPLILLLVCPHKINRLPFLYRIWRDSSLSFLKAPNKIWGCFPECVFCVCGRLGSPLRTGEFTSNKLQNQRFMCMITSTIVKWSEITEGTSAVEENQCVRAEQGRKAGEGTYSKSLNQIAVVLQHMTTRR